jgi:hypothetical protein
MSQPRRDVADAQPRRDVGGNVLFSWRFFLIFFLRDLLGDLQGRCPLILSIRCNVEAAVPQEAVVL